MSTTYGKNTPGGSGNTINPPSKEEGLKDSGGGKPLLSLFSQSEENPFQRKNNILRSPTSKQRNISTTEASRSHPGSKVHENFSFKSPEATDTNSKLEEENRELRDKLDKLENIIQVIEKLKEEVNALKKENEKLKSNCNTDITEIAKLNRACCYSTDEEELERETDWILKKKRPSKRSKKRSAESSPDYCEPEKPSTTGAGNKNNREKHSPVTTAAGNKINKENQPPAAAAPANKNNKEKQPPPINIIGVTNYSDIQFLMKSVTDKEYKVTALNNDVWKINTFDSDTYRTLSMKLKVEGIQWFSYEDKNSRPINVMARGLHPTCAIDDIISDLKSKGLKVLNAVNIIKKERAEVEGGNPTYKKRGLPLFMLSFDNKENIQNIYGISGILNMRVKIEAVRKTTTRIVQCKNCQGFNHTQKYCGRDPRCVKCAGAHPTQACQFPRSTAAKCINCKEQHPASYRGCEVAKKLQKIRNQKLNNPSRNRGNPPAIARASRIEEKGTRQNIQGVKNSYAQVVKNVDPGKFPENNDNQLIKNLMTSINSINKRLDEQNKFNSLILEQIKKLELPERKTDNKQK